MMLRWISLVPPMIELARVVSRPRAQRPRRRAVVVGVEQRAGPSTSTAVSYEPLARRRPRTASRCSTPRRSPRRVRAGRACARCAAGRSRRRSTTARAAGARAGRRAAALPRTPSIRRSIASFEQHLLLPDERRAALVGERRVRDPPALVLGADEVLDRHLDVVEEHLVELVLAGHLAQRAHVDARRVHRDREHRDALVRAARRGRCARARCPCRRTSRTTTTPSGPVTRYDAAALLGARVESAARSLPAPGSLNSWHQTSSAPRIRGIQRARCSSVPCAISVGPTSVTPAPPEERRRAGARELLVVDRDLRQRRAATAVLDRPVDADPAAGVQRALPVAQHRPRRRASPRPRRPAAGAPPATPAARREQPRRRRRGIGPVRYGRPADQVTVFSCVYSSSP